MSIFTTLGMFIIDENRYVSPSYPPQENIIGGAGPYAMIGARIVSPAQYSRKISGIIDEGTDFPVKIREEIDTWQTGAIFRKNHNRLTTRGVNIYENGIRSFEYQTPKKRIEVEDVLQYPELRQSQCYHLICSIDRCKLIIEELGKVNPNAIYIYEPLPDDCLFENYNKLKEVLPLIHVFSPNLDEAKALTSTNSINADLTELCNKFTSYQKIANSGTVIRCGASGCHIQTSKEASPCQLNVTLPAYHQDQSKVIDVTGGGNSFCGGFIMVWFLSGQDWITSGVCGIISSGCIIEKLGMPVLEQNKFNGLSLEERLGTYFKKNPQLADKYKLEIS